MCELICDEPALLRMMSRFGICLGVGDKTVQQVCTEHGVDTATFLAVANYIKHGPGEATLRPDLLSLACLTHYLRQAHTYFLDFQLPTIRRKLLEALDCSKQDDVAYHILRYYDEYMGEVRKHMLFENRKVFAYVEGLQAGRRADDYSIDRFARSHSSIDRKLQELKNIIIRFYVPTEHAELLHGVLFDLFTCEQDLRTHCGVEDDLFVPAVRILEEQVAEGTAPLSAQPGDGQPENAMLSEREREIVHKVVCGLSNKQIAESLFISLNTVLTHRKNIARKLDIHSVAGLTIYAIVNKLVDINELDTKG